MGEPAARLLPAFCLTELAQVAWRGDAPAGDVSMTTGVLGQIGVAPSAADLAAAFEVIHPRSWQASEAPGLWTVYVPGGSRVVVVDLDDDRGVLVALPLEAKLLTGSGWGVAVFKAPPAAVH